MASFSVVWLRRVLVVALVGISAATGLYLHAEEKKSVAGTPQEDPKKAAIRKEYQGVRKDQYLKMVDEREKYYRAMADEMKAVHAACKTEDKEACKKAKDHSKEVREKLQESRKANIEKFNTKVDEYRKKLGEGPTDVEKQHKALKAKQDDGKL